MNKKSSRSVTHLIGDNIHVSQIRPIILVSHLNHTDSTEADEGIVGILIQLPKDDAYYGVFCAHSVSNIDAGDAIDIGILHDPGVYSSDLIYKNKAKDIAIIKISKQVINKIKKSITPIMLKELPAFSLTNAKKNDGVFFTSGHELMPREGKISRVGKTLNILAGSDIHRAQSGDSGSAIIHQNSNSVLGIVNWQNGQKITKGISINTLLDEIRIATNKNITNIGDCRVFLPVTDVINDC